MSGDSAAARTAADAMIPMRDGCVPMNCARDVLDIVREMDVTGMPVTRSFEGSEMLGFVLQSDLEKAEAQPGGGPRIVDVPWQPARTLRPDAPLDDVPREHVHIVVDESEGLLGVLEAAR